MTISAYQISVPVFIQALNGLSGILTKAIAQAEARKIDQAAILSFRLYPDMFPFTRQVQIACDFAKGGAGRVAQDDFPNYPDDETSLEALKGRVDNTLAYLRGLDAAKFEGAEDREVNLVRRGETHTVNALDYLLTQAKPNFYFHLAMAYAILRHNGFELGKRDFLGAA